MADRLTKADWIDHGLSTLAKEGWRGLAVGPMSIRLKVSRGSFYWHFQDIADFRSQLLQSWQERSTDRVIRDLDAREGQADRLKLLLQQAFAGGRDLDRAIRSWATTDASAAKIVASVDSRRVDRIADLLTDAGVDRRRAQHRAAFLYWAYLGQVAIMDSRRSTIPASALDDICGMFES